MIIVICRIIELLGFSECLHVTCGACGCRVVSLGKDIRRCTWLWSLFPFLDMRLNREGSELPAKMSFLKFFKYFSVCMLIDYLKGRHDTCFQMAACGDSRAVNLKLHLSFLTGLCMFHYLWKGVIKSRHFLSCAEPLSYLYICFYFSISLSTENVYGVLRLLFMNSLFWRKGVGCSKE